MTIGRRVIDTVLLGAYEKKADASILEIICLFRVYLVFLLLALESTQDADPAKNRSKS